MYRKLYIFTVTLVVLIFRTYRFCCRAKNVRIEFDKTRIFNFRKKKKLKSLHNPHTTVKDFNYIFSKII